MKETIETGLVVIDRSMCRVDSTQYRKPVKG
jgi:hypothetical protein